MSSVCDFESIDLCGFVNDVVDSEFEWKRTAASDEQLDHTYGTKLGHYMQASVAERSQGVQGRLARFLSPLYTDVTNICVRFWYKIRGDIKFRMRTYAFHTYNEHVAYEARGDRGNEWLLARVSLSYSAPFQYVFEAEDSGNGGRVLIDDVHIGRTECESTVGSCDFEHGWCGFTTPSDSDFSWQIVDGYYGRNDTVSSMPACDHTTGQPYGSFMHMDAYKRAEHERALLESEVVADTSDFRCVQFYVRSNRLSDTGLALYRKNKRSGEMARLWEFANHYAERDDAYEDAWHMREVQLPFAADLAWQTFDNPYSFVFEGSVGRLNTHRSEMSLDDVLLYEGVCETTLKAANATTYWFDCQNDGERVDANKVCNFVADCSNGMDERNCGNCDFEQSFMNGW